MAYSKQAWRDYDDTKTENQNRDRGAVVTPERLNHMETGIANSAERAELEQTKQDITSQLAQKAKQTDLNVERARINNLTAHAGDTDGNAELLDMRVGADGNIYPSAGDATRVIGEHVVKELNFTFRTLPSGVSNDYDEKNDKLIKRVAYKRLSRADIRAGSIDGDVVLVQTTPFVDANFSNSSMGNILIEGKEEVEYDISSHKPENIGKFYTSHLGIVSFILPKEYTLEEARDILAGIEIHYELKTEVILEPSEVTSNTARLAEIQKVAELEKLRDSEFTFRKLPNGISNDYDEKNDKLIKRVAYKRLSRADIETVNSLEDITMVTTIVFTDSNITSASIGNVLIDGRKEVPYSTSSETVENIGNFYTSPNKRLQFMFPKGTTLKEAMDALEGTEIYYQLLEESVLNPNELESHTAHLAKVSKKIESVEYKVPTVPPKKEGKVTATFISDDGPIEDYTVLKPIFETEGVPFSSTPVVNLTTGRGDRLNVTHLLEMQEMGWEILSHGKAHVRMGTLTEDELEVELGESKRIFTEMGLDIKGVVYPYGSYNNLVKKVARKHYESGYLYGTSAKINTQPYDTFALYRISLGSSFDPPISEYPITNTFEEYYKVMVDKAVENDAWIIFTLHPHQAEFDEEQKGYLIETIQYIKSLGIPIKNPSEVLNEYGNIFEGASYNEDHSKETLFRVGGDGKLYAELGEL